MEIEKVSADEKESRTTGRNRAGTELNEIGRRQTRSNAVQVQVGISSWEIGRAHV